MFLAEIEIILVWKVFFETREVNPVYIAIFGGFENILVSSYLKHFWAIEYNEDKVSVITLHEDIIFCWYGNEFRLQSIFVI